MGNKVELKLDAREVHGKKVKTLRASGIVPAVVYGHGVEPVSVQASRGVLEKAYRAVGTHSPLHITLDGKKHIAMVKDVEMDAVKHLINHVAFHVVKASDPVTAEVPIHLTNEGESEAEKAGMVVLQTLEKIEVKALPLELPEALEVSVLGLKAAGDKLLVSDITLPKNVELVDVVADPNSEEETHSVTELVVASAYEPSALAAANDAAAGESETGDADEVAAENGNEDDAKE